MAPGAYMLGPAGAFRRANLLNTADNTRVDFAWNPEHFSITVAGNNGRAAGANSQSNGFGAPSGGSGTGGGTTGRTSGSGGSSGGATGPDHRGTQHPQGANSSESIDLELYLDGDFYKSITDDIKTLRNWVKGAGRQGDTSGTNPLPPPDTIQLWIGDTPWMTGTLTKLMVKFEHLLPNGLPCRALSNITIQRKAQSSRKQNPTSGALTSYTGVTMAAGDTLQSVAYREYGRASLWRRLAEINGIDDPLRIPPGTMMLLPNLTELMAGAD